MWMDNVFSYGVDILLSAFAVYLFIYYFDIFFVRKKSKYLLITGVTLFAFWQFGITSIIDLPAYANILVTIIVTLISVIVIYESTLWKKYVFVIAFNAIWMLMETLCGYILLIYCEEYAYIQSVGSVVSKIFFLVVIFALKKVFTDEEIKELPAKYSILLVLIPTGSIYIMNNIFMLGFTIDNDHASFNSAITAIILLGMNVLIFYIYMKLADDLCLRRMTSIYEQQLELCERHQQEREISMLQFRDAKHNMKNNLVSILAYAENRDYEKIIDFVNEILDTGGMVSTDISHSGNIVIDSLISYWFMVAKQEKIEFTVDICVPMMMPFKGADICLILGNLLENAVEAAKKVESKRYIKIKVKYDKSNLLVFVSNSYRGTLMKTKNQRLKSTKSDAENHGVGLSSVYRAVTKYHGTIVINDSIPECFRIRVLLYGYQKKLHE